MNSGSAQPSRIRFGPFELDNASGELRKAGIPLKIQPQPFRVLSLLVEHAGDVVSREEIQHALWNGDTFVDYDRSINFCVNQIRVALSDDAERPRYVETLPRRGYRFIAAVNCEAPSAPASPLPAAHSASGPLLNIPDSESRKPSDPRLPQRPPELPVASDSTVSKPSRVETKPRWRRWAAATAVLLAGLTAFFFYVHSRAAPQNMGVEVVPLTGMAEEENEAAFSPDGNHIAFKLAEPADRAGIYIMVISGERPLRLTTGPNDCCPVWSPDGRAVAFSRIEQGGYTIYTVPALGGTPKVLYSGRSEFAGHAGVEPSFSWSPNGTQLAVTAISPQSGRPAITLISLGDGSSRPITSPPLDHSDWYPSFSPDGKSVAFLRSSGPGFDDDLYTVPVTGGQDKRLTFDNRQLGGEFAWTPDSRDILFGSGRAGAWTIWRIAAAGGKPQRVEGVGISARGPTVALSGQRLAYTSYSSRASLARVNLIDSKHISGPPQTLLAAKTYVGLASFSADGKKLAFESGQSGYDEIWTAKSDGSDPTQLSSLAGESGTPHWSYDGRLVAFDYRPAEQSEIYIAEVSGGPPRRFETNPGANNFNPTWSRDGHWIYFASSRGEDAVQVWKAQYPVGSTIQLTEHGGTFPVEGADGYLYYSKSLYSDEIWKIPVAGGPESLVVKAPDLRCFCNWTLAAGGVYLIAGEPGKQRRLSFYDFSDRTLTELMRFEKHSFNPALSPDGKFLIFAQMDEQDQTIMLVNHFH
jgi:Tol biopolymer transport system component/DNA-binding winged helix-turn-helix (wHTH) protein